MPSEDAGSRTSGAYHLTCTCGWDETVASQERAERRAVSHGYSDEKHRWTVTDDSGEVVDRAR